MNKNFADTCQFDQLKPRSVQVMRPVKPNLVQTTGSKFHVQVPQRVTFTCWCPGLKFPIVCLMPLYRQYHRQFRERDDIIILVRPSLEYVFFDFSLTVKAAPHECVIWTGQP